MEIKATIRHRSLSYYREKMIEQAVSDRNRRITEQQERASEVYQANKEIRQKKCLHNRISYLQAKQKLKQFENWKWQRTRENHCR